MRRHQRVSVLRARRRGGRRRLGDPPERRRVFGDRGEVARGLQGDDVPEGLRRKSRRPRAPHLAARHALLDGAREPRRLVHGHHLRGERRRDRFLRRRRGVVGDRARVARGELRGRAAVVRRRGARGAAARRAPARLLGHGPDGAVAAGDPRRVGRRRGARHRAVLRPGHELRLRGRRRARGRARYEVAAGRPGAARPGARADRVRSVAEAQR
mmetsp:Transcript_18115/g.55734  ORF Transcript_18115/g.55734 Transcript_18115/m.55734 type:complete len:213 (-) Transcript_18115:450-1088(-)